jgi:hypothetical protein
MLICLPANSIAKQAEASDDQLTIVSRPTKDKAGVFDWWNSYLSLNTTDDTEW